jgi:hypothetical protein
MSIICVRGVHGKRRKRSEWRGSSTGTAQGDADVVRIRRISRIDENKAM